jgi:uncharacterized membrane protein YvlD (DUF360 family)
MGRILGFDKTAQLIILGLFLGMMIGNQMWSSAALAGLSSEARGFLCFLGFPALFAAFNVLVHKAVAIWRDRES